MTGSEAYRWLMDASSQLICDEFDLHVLASILAIALEEAEDLAAGTGLARQALFDIATRAFPAIAADIAAMSAVDVSIDVEEQSLRDILMIYASGASWLELPLAAMIARRCKAPHHLWQDLGLGNRSELSALMRRHFSPLANRNSQDMKWKRFFYRMVCSTEGFTLCTAPVCTDCDDFDHCFGTEDGEARLARLRNARVAPAPNPPLR